MTKYPQVLTNKRINEQLADQGYVTVPFLEVDEVETLTQYYYQSHNKTLEGMYATAHLPDIDKRLAMNNFIKQVFERAIDENLNNITALGGSFIAKGKGERGSLHPHQDWNIVDESLYRSFNIWVPLVDLNDNNGAIMVLPESHNWLDNYRSANIHSAFSQLNDVLWQRLVPLHMKAGEALIYDHRLLHASGPNSTDEIRLACVYGVVPQGVPMMYYHQKDEHSVEVFESNPEFFLQGNIFEGPKGLKSLGTVPFTFEQISLEQLNNFMGIENQSTAPTITPTISKPTLLQKMRALFHV